MTHRFRIALWPSPSGPAAGVSGVEQPAAHGAGNNGVHPWFDPSIRDEFFEEDLPIDATCFHIYAVEWKPHSIDFYVDNQKLRTIHQSPGYPMQFMLGIYELPGQASAVKALYPAGTYPKEFVVDYVRAYQPDGGYEAV